MSSWWLVQCLCCYIYFLWEQIIDDVLHLSVLVCKWFVLDTLKCWRFWARWWWYSAFKYLSMYVGFLKHWISNELSGIFFTKTYERKGFSVLMWSHNIYMLFCLRDHLMIALSTYLSNHLRFRPTESCVSKSFPYKCLLKLGIKINFLPFAHTTDF